jgi:subtilisin-like proprotein convertase family protein
MSHRPPRRALSALAATTVLAGLGVAAPVSGASGSFANPDPITISDPTGAAGHHVSAGSADDIVLTGDPGDTGSPATVELVAPAGAEITDIWVHVELFHERLDDVDLMLVSPTGNSTMLLSDVGGDHPFGDRHLGFSPRGSAFPAGDTDTFPSPAPAGAAAEFDSMYGTSPTGTWSLHAVDDTSGKAGFIDNWSMIAYFSVPASPGSSDLAVSGLPNGITDVNLTLHDIDLNHLGDTDFVLESPDGRRAHVLSDAGEHHAVTDVTLTLDDEAAEQVRRGSVPTTGTYRPVDYDDYDGQDEMNIEYVGGRPTANLSSALSTFDGADPNGTWELYVVQEYCCNDGAISGGWSLNITTTDATATPVITSPANGSTDTDGAVTFTGTTTAGALVKVTTGGQTRNTVADDGGVWTVSFDDLADGSHTFTATATDGSGNVSARVTITVAVDREEAVPDAVVVGPVPDAVVVGPVTVPVPVLVPVLVPVPEVDTTAPKVRTVKPRKDERRISVSASAMVRFSEAMDVASVKRAVKLVSTNTGKEVDVELTYKTSKNRVTINPKQNLERNTTYKVVVETTAKDLVGNGLLRTRKSTFKTT